jgi:hypothetical protein
VAKTPSKPKAFRNPVTDADVEYFDRAVVKWQALLNLRDWRIVRESARDLKHMASLTGVEHPHKLARYRVGVDFKSAAVTPQSLESTALHELLHLLLRPMLDVAMAEGDHNDSVMEYEHAVIVILEQLLMAAYGGDT